METITERIAKLEKSVKSMELTMIELKESVRPDSMVGLPANIILVIQELFQFVENEIGVSNPPLRKKISALLKDVS